MHVINVILLVRFMSDETTPEKATVIAKVTSSSGTTQSKSITIPRNLRTESYPVIVPWTQLPTDFPLSISVSASTAGKGTIMFSPVELILDKPVYLGCFSMETGKHVSAISSVLACLVHCRQNQLRFSLLENGTQCSCMSIINHDNFTDLPNGKCNIKCSNADEYTCGGVSATSLYVAGKNNKFN